LDIDLSSSKKILQNKILFRKQYISIFGDSQSKIKTGAKFKPLTSNKNLSKRDLESIKLNSILRKKKFGFPSSISDNS